MGGVLIAVTLLTSVSNAQRSAPPPQTGSAVELPPLELHPLAHSSEATPTTPQTPISSLPTATPAARNTAPAATPLSASRDDVQRDGERSTITRSPRSSGGSTH